MPNTTKRRQPRDQFSPEYVRNVLEPVIRQAIAKYAAKHKAEPKAQ